MRQKRVTAVQHTGNRRRLMRFQRNLRRHTRKLYMRTVILTGSGAVEPFVVQANKLLPTGGVFERPILERLLDCVLFLCGKCGFFPVQHTDFFAFFNFRVVNPHIL
jgi:hypothetical protein